jgi:lipoprotein-anchoring transpeptidase ErfK/SrfK
MRAFAWAFALAAMLLAAPARAAPSVVAKIDLSEQRMHVYVGGVQRYTWAVSTARRGYRTPVGTFRPVRLEREWYSRKYHWSPMPHSIFFLGGYAIHGTDAVKSLGAPASHGCVRLHPSNAATLFTLVRRTGMKNTSIVVRR